MTTRKHLILHRPLIRWLALAGTAAALMVPFSASASQNNGVVEVLASAAVAYVIVDAVGGFDDKDKKHRKVHYRDHRHGHAYRHAKKHRYYHDRRYYNRHFKWHHDRRDWRHHDNRRYWHRQDHRRFDDHRRKHDRHHAKDHGRKQWRDHGRHQDRRSEHRGGKDQYRRIAWH